MHNLAYYYKNVEKDYEQMEQYYLMAMKHNHKGAINNLGPNKQFYTLSVTRPNGTTKFTVVFNVVGDNANVTVTKMLTSAELSVGSAGVNAGACVVE